MIQVEIKNPSSSLLEFVRHLQSENRRKTEELKNEVMTNEEILVDNKLIAEFMGYKILHHENDPYLYSKNGIQTNPPVFYNNDWNSIMEVVEKIESLGFSISILNNSCCVLIKGKGIAESITKRYINSESKIKSVWLAIIEFIKWYNKQEKS